MEVKICGITRLEDALRAAEWGAHGLGFVFYPPSPRYIEPERALRIIERLPNEVAVVGVFVDENPIVVKAVASKLGLHLIQLHGHEPPEGCKALQGLKVIKALRGSFEEFDLLGQYRGLWAVLLDGFDPRIHDSTGKIANWELGDRIKENYRLVLAGGLNEGNLKEAITKVRPDALDVSSALEECPGKKDPVKMKRFLRLVKEVSKGFPSRPVFLPCVTLTKGDTRQGGEA